MAEPTIAEKQEQFSEVAGQLLDGAFKRLGEYDVARWLEGFTTEGLGTLLGVAVRAMAPVGIGIAKGIAASENVVAPALADMAAASVNDMFGTNVSPANFSGGIRGGTRGDAASALGRGLIEQLTGSNTNLQPDSSGAARYLTFIVNMALEGWYQKWFFEFLTSLIPQLDVGKIENYGSLDDKMAQALGLGRLSRRVLSPLIDASIVTPLRWQTNKTYTPELLSASATARQVARGRWTRERGIEELARQGYSPERIEAVLNEQRKFFSASDVRQFVTREHWSRDAGLQHLKDQGYEPDAAEDALRLEGLRRIEQLEGQEAAALISAYASRDIDRVTFTGMLADVVGPAPERALYTELAEVRRAVNIKRLSLSQVEQMVKSGVLAVSDYREAARRDGYEERDVIALELQLRYELQKDKDITEARRQAAEERAAEQAARDAERAKRKAEVEAERALAKRGAESDLERAAVRGLIPFSRLEEVYVARYDADTVAILLSIVEDARLDYVTQQEARTAALQRGARRNISAGDAEQAFMVNLLTADELRRRLESLGFDGADAQLLTATAVVRKAELDAAKRARAEAARRAQSRSIDLGRFERLVRRGARTVAEYTALLESLGFDEASRAAMAELLQLAIADDARAREARAAAEAELQTRGLSLEQFRRGVLLGVKTVDDFERFLIEQRFTADAQIVLLAELRADLAEAEAARAQREAAPTAVDARALSLAVVARAARLGVISPDAYVDRLRRAGFAEDDVDLQLELLLLEMADIQAARARRDNLEATAQPRGLSLADMERAVKAGIRAIDDYRARAAELGYGQAATDDLVALLELELAQLEDARRRRRTIVQELAARNLSLAQLEEAVTKGFKTLDEFVADVEALGYGTDDAELLAALLAVDLEAKAAGG